MTNNKYKILLVEDEENIRTFVSALLEANGYRVITAGEYSEAKTMYLSYTPDLVILDLGLPDRDGSNLLSDIRREFLTPVIVLSARSEESEKIKLLDMGANDYITKPFGSGELLARVRTAIRNTRHELGKGNLPCGIFTLRDLTIDYGARRVFLKNEEIHLTQTEYNILAFLSEHSGKVLTYSAIIKSVWHESTDDANVKKLQVNMANIRKKFGSKPGEIGYIVNELGVGYRING